MMNAPETGVELIAMFSKIAVATDGSQIAENAVQTAIDMAVKYGSELTVVHVLLHREPPDALMKMAEIEHLISRGPQSDITSESLRNPFSAFVEDPEKSHLSHDLVALMGEQLVKNTKAKADEAGIPTVNVKVLDGDPAPQIVDAIKQVGADLVVIGSRGLSPLKRLLIGSVSRNVMQETECTCMIVK